MIRRSFAAVMVIALCATQSVAQQPKFQSKVITTATPGHAVEIDVDITGAKELYLVVRDGGDGYGADWSDWAEPRLVMTNGEKKLTELKWKTGTTEWGQIGVNQNVQGAPLRIAGKPVEYGIGTHANSVIAFDLPDGVTRFKARGGIDNGGSDQGSTSSVQFLVFTEKPSARFIQPTSAAGTGSRDPKDAVAGLDVADGLEATLFASEASGLLSPADIDVDHLGRVWVCEVVNYRHRNGERKAGDRILVVEDQDGDGVSDKQTVFFQGHEVDSALGICVLPTASGKGTRVLVSCAPNVWIFTDDDGDLKADKKELLFTKAGDPQHDHSTHTFVFGPDGKLYWNVGNTGHRVCDKDGKPIIDMAGHEVNDGGKPYRHGMAFRCNPDGSEFEVLGHNFRNNYELTVDSFGTVWQSDNDDDGNQGVRINYVMEGGNFGYTDETTGASWPASRTNIEAEIPQRHWHQNDPGVVPNLLLTGAGSPTGICIYEGRLLPTIFHNQIIHCDAGPNVVRAYPSKKAGAGYTAHMENVLFGARDNWFRPSDVCVAPDGSLIIADWYDPGVGGHRMGDVDKGRLIRVAPPKTRYDNPKIDVSTAEGAIQALKSPNLVARYLGWITLQSMLTTSSDSTSAALGKVFESDPDARIRARALGVLAKSSAHRSRFIDAATKDKDPDIRIAGLRLARQKLATEDAQTNTHALVDILARLISDSAIEVRRECALALRLLKSPRKAELWGKLAVQHDGKDRWYLEALGIGADNDWDNCLAAAEKTANDPSAAVMAASPTARDIIWRSRGTTSGEGLEMILMAKHITAADAPRYMRAFDFLPAAVKDDHLQKLAFADFGNAAKTQYINTEAISRLKGFDVTKSPERLAAMNRILDGLKGNAQFVSLVDKFNVAGRFSDLLAMAQAKPDEQLSIDAVRVLLAKKQTQLLTDALSTKQGKAAIATATVLSNSGDAQAADLLLPLAKDANLPSDLRREAIKGAARSRQGASELVKLSEAKQFDDSLAPALSAALHGSSFEDARRAATKLFPLPEGKDAKPLPPLADLAKMKGNVGNGHRLFRTTGKCATCHVVQGEGKEVGPNLSEIGSKLSRQAMFESIIFPSAGISHNYESWTLALKDGTVQTGIITNEDGTKVTLKGADAIARTFDLKDVEERSKQTISLMPADLSKILSQEEMADVVEYLTVLKKPQQ